DAWCAAFVIPKVKSGEVLTEAVFRQLVQHPSGGSTSLKHQIRELAGQYLFLHWHLAFPDVFRVPRNGEEPTSDKGWGGGFDLVCGNPPWDQVQLDDREFFA